MARDLTSDALAAITGETVARTAAVELLFDSGAVRLCGAPYPMTIDGHTYLGAGSLGSISAAEESADLQATSITLSLAGIPRDLVSTALTEAYQNRRATVWEVPLNPSTELPVADPIIVFRGRMDVMTIQLDATSATIAITVTNRLADWERPANLLFSDVDQQRLHAGDHGLEFAAGMETREVNWPTSQWFRNNVK